MKLPQLKGVRGSGPKDIGQEDRGGGVVVVLVAVVFVLGTLWWGSGFASMRDKGLARAGAAEQDRDGMALKLLFWELEKHLKR